MLFKLLSTTVLATLFSVNVFAAAAADSPIGYWKTIDDKTGQPKSIVHIWQIDDQHLAGKVVRIYPKPGETQAKLCDACQGELHNQPVVGMQILADLTKEDAEWQHGHILDPENGKIYQVSMRLGDNGRHLNVHGYIGIPLFGRTQTWDRVDLLSGKG